MAPALGAVLWHGGYRAPAQVALAAIAVAGALAYRPRPMEWRDPLWIGLVAVAVANAASLAWHPHRSSIAPALAVAALPVIVAIAARHRADLRRRLPVVVVALALASATAGLAGLALRTTPVAERIDGVWRAGGTFEYPPALGLFCVCGLAYVLALHAAGDLDRTTSLVAAAILAAAIGATFDRAAWVATPLVLVLFAVRVPATRRTVGLLAAVAATCALAAGLASHPGRAALERHLRHGALSSRRAVWDESADAVARRPWLGFGPGRFTVVNDGDATLAAGSVVQAHDAVLEQTVEAGILAGLGAALVLAAMLVAGLRGAVTGDALGVGHGVAATAIALSGLYDFTWSFAPIVLLGALAAVAARQRGQPRPTCGAAGAGRTTPG